MLKWLSVNSERVEEIVWRSLGTTFYETCCEKKRKKHHASEMTRTSVSLHNLQLLFNKIRCQNNKKTLSTRLQRPTNVSRCILRGKFLKKFSLAKKIFHRVIISWRPMQFFGFKTEKKKSNAKCSLFDTSNEVTIKFLDFQRHLVRWVFGRTF